MSDEPVPAEDACDRALKLLIADGAKAARLARAVSSRPQAGPGQRALAHSVLALYEFREGTLAAGMHHVALAEPLVDHSVPGQRAALMLVHARAQNERRLGQLALAESRLRELHAQADSRPPLDAYLCASALGTVLSMRADDDAALDLYYQALALARRTGEDSLIVNALNNLGSFQSDLHNLDDASILLEECLAGALRVGSRRQIIYAAGNLVECLCHMGQAARALAVANEHLIGRIRPQDPAALHRDEEIARVLLDNGLVAQAEDALGGQAHVDPLSNEMATSRIWLEGRILLARGEADRALRLSLARHRLLKREGQERPLPIDWICLMRLASEAAYRVGRHRLACRLLEEAFETHERLLGRAARSRQLSLQITHRLSHAEWERDAARQLAQRLESLNASLQAQVLENERLQGQLRAQALEDPLTGAHNRRHLMEAGPALLSSMRRRAAPVSVVLVDMDHFKQINDRHGHETGDCVLRTFADMARHALRAEDLVCRYGGEEFVLVLAGSGEEQATRRVEELLARFGEMRFAAAHEGEFACSFSAGVAGSADASASLQLLLKRADEALYAAKAAGRACVQRAAATMAPPQPSRSPA
jgi:two-component system, cell cycle response regulator